MQAVASYPVLDLAEAERRVILTLRKVANEGGYGDVRITVKEGRIVTIRREIIEQVRSEYGR